MTSPDRVEVSRRRVLHAAAWTTPTIVAVAAAPAYAASLAVAPKVTTATVRECGREATGSRRIYEVDLTLSSRATSFEVISVVVGKRDYKPDSTTRAEDPAWRMGLTTDQPLSSSGVLSLSYMSDGVFQSSPVSFTTSTDACVA